MGAEDIFKIINYHFDKRDEGYIIKPATEFIKENEDILSNEQIKEIDINMISLGVYENITPEMKQDYAEYTRYMEDLKQRRMTKMETQTNTRSM